jgi:hypothetical protein
LQLFRRLPLIPRRRVPSSNNRFERSRGIASLVQGEGR